MTVELTLLPRVAYRGREITGPRQCGLLALLAGDPRGGCGTGRLVDGLWPGERPEHPAKALQVVVSRVRAQVGADVIARTPTGYRLTVPAERIDAAAVLLGAEAGARLARAGDHAGALAHAEAGLALWAGAEGVPAHAETGLWAGAEGVLAHAETGLWAGAEGAAPAAGDPLSELRAQRAATRRALLRLRALALSRLGRHVEAAEPLAAVARALPWDEEVLLELLRAEAATAGPAAALARYDEHRRLLRAELGTDPGPALQDEHRRLLRAVAPAVRQHIPHEPNPLLGRDGDVAAVTGMLGHHRVTSIVGAGGLGKTRLAHAVGREAPFRVVHLVALAGVGDEDDVAREVATVLGAGEVPRGPAGGRPVPSGPVAGIIEALGPGPALLVLDNCEHVVGGVAALVHALVAATKELRVLTTSRAPLGISAEAVYALPELSLPSTVELFGQRATAARPGVELPADAVRELCGRLDGLPLAVELAAARVRVMSVAEIACHLDDRFALLRGGARDAPARHHTLHAVIDWSWNLLAPDGRAAMRALSVFPGGFTADAARHMLGDRALHVVEQLVDQSLLKVADTAAGTRFRMLETVREFSAARRDEAGETGAVTGRFLTWAAGFGRVHHESLFGPGVAAGVEVIRAEQDNLGQALRWALDRGDGAAVAAATAVLAALWTVESNFNRMSALATDTGRALSHLRPEPADVGTLRTAAVLCAVGGLLVGRSHPERWLVTVRRLPPVRPDTPMRAAAVVIRAMTASRGLDLSVLETLRHNDHAMVAAVADGVAGYVREHEGDVEGALGAARRMLAVFDDPATPWMRAVAHSRVSELCLDAGDGDGARRHLRAALSAVAGFEAWAGAVRMRWAMVLANLQCGDLDEAEHWLGEAVRTGGDEAAGMPMIDVAIRAEILLARGDAEAGLRLWRRVADGVGDPAAGRRNELPGSASWIAEAQATAVVAHAGHGRLDLVTHLTDRLPALLAERIPGPPPGHAIVGVLLLALAMVDIDRGARAGDARAARSGARMIALAEAFRFMRGLQPTMSVARARRAAERADPVAYAEAVPVYAALGRAALPDAAAAALRARERFTAPDPA